jgi:hypothetical protein
VRLLYLVGSLHVRGVSISYDYYHAPLTCHGVTVLNSIALNTAVNSGSVAITARPTLGVCDLEVDTLAVA